MKYSQIVLAFFVECTWNNSCKFSTNNQTVVFNYPSIWTLIQINRLYIDSDDTKLAQFDMGHLQIYIYI